MAGVRNIVVRKIIYVVLLVLLSPCLLAADGVIDISQENMGKYGISVTRDFIPGTAHLRYVVRAREPKSDEKMLVVANIGVDIEGQKVGEMVGVPSFSNMVTLLGTEKSLRKAVVLITYEKENQLRSVYLVKLLNWLDSVSN